MADVETYGGKCPICGKGLLQKYDTGFGCGLEFDACPWCGFAAGSEGNGEDVEYHSLWNEILNHFNVKTKEDIIKTLELKEYMSEEESERYPTVFYYDKDNKWVLGYKKVLETNDYSYLYNPNKDDCKDNENCD